MGAKTINSSPAGTGDGVVGLWIAEGARSVGEEILFVDGGRSEIFRAFGHSTVSEPSEDCMVLGSGSNTYDEELRTCAIDNSPRPIRWQRTVGWSYQPLRPNLQPLSEDAVAWAEHMTQNRPTVVIAPKANIDSRSMPMQKWIRIAWSLASAGIHTVAIDARKEVVDPFPFYAFGFGWSHILALLARAAVVAGNDSGIPHIAATIGVPTVAAMGPTDPNVVFGHCRDVLIPVVADTVPCVGCHFAHTKGYQIACDHGCDGLHSIPWQAVQSAIVSALVSREE